MVVPFVDTDGDQHPVGEQWTYIGSWFSKFDDEVTLFVSQSDGTNLVFSLKWTPEAQQHVIEHVQTHICRV